jgi:hypothetical protein
MKRFISLPFATLNKHTFWLFIISILLLFVLEKRGLLLLSITELEFVILIKVSLFFIETSVLSLAIQDKDKKRIILRYRLFLIFPLMLLSFFFFQNFFLMFQLESFSLTDEILKKAIEEDKNLLLNNFKFSLIGQMIFIGLIFLTARFHKIVSPRDAG